MWHAVHPISFELRNSRDMMTAVRVALLLCAIIYFTIGIFGYLLFGDSLMSDILTNFDQAFGSSTGALLNDIVRLSYAFHLMLVYPLLNFSLRFNINELLFPNKPPLASATTRFLTITMALLLFSYLAAIAFPNIWSIFQFMGSTSAACLAFIFPGAITLRYFAPPLECVYINVCLAWNYKDKIQFDRYLVFGCLFSHTISLSYFLVKF